MLLKQVLSEISSFLFPLFQREQKVLKLALRAEYNARKLNGISTTTTSEDNVVEILQSLCQLLERLVEHPDLFLPNEQCQSLTVVASPSLHEEPKPIFDQELELSSPMKELIQIRDWVLLAKSDETGLGTNMLEALYTQLGQVLAKGDVMTIEETGVFNYERQQIISTQVTNKPDNNNLVYKTVRPGYLFCGRLVRPQEIIIYTYEESI